MFAIFKNIFSNLVVRVSEVKLRNVVTGLVWRKCTDLLSVLTSTLWKI